MRQKNIKIIYSGPTMNIIGFFCKIMILKDAEKYFKYCYDNSWSETYFESRALYEMYTPKILNILKDNNICVNLWFNIKSHL